jgi:dTMP kinase
MTAQTLATVGAAIPNPYLPADTPRAGLFVVLEGINASGKSTLAALLAERVGCRHFHTVPAPVNDLQPYINARARAFPQLAFYLAGALHASDLAREALTRGHAVADRYVNSVIANHAAVHNLDNDTVAATIAPFTGYLAVPDLTIYLHTDLDELVRRMRIKRDQTQSDRDLVKDRVLLQRLQDHYDQISHSDPTAYHLHTDGRTPDELAARIANLMTAQIASPDPLGIRPNPTGALPEIAWLACPGSPGERPCPTTSTARTSACISSSSSRARCSYSSVRKPDSPTGHGRFPAVGWTKGRRCPPAPPARATKNSGSPSIPAT